MSNKEWRKGSSFTAGELVWVWDRYNFAIPLKARIHAFSEVNDGVGVLLLESNNPSYPVGTAHWVHERQLTHAQVGNVVIPAADSWASRAGPPAESDDPSAKPDEASPNANDRQVGGSNYKSMKIQPWDYILENNIPFLEATAIYYVTRWRSKGGVQDLHKAIHVIEKLIEREEKK